MKVAVVMRRERIVNRWQPWRWVLEDVVVHREEFGSAVQCVETLADSQRWLFPGFAVELLATDTEGYYLNATTEQPCFWVVWRMEEEPAEGTEPLAVPTIVTLSYHDAGRWLDAQENVDQVPASSEVVAWLRQFVNDHHVPEIKRRQRPESFKGLQDRFGQPARVSTLKNLGGPDHG